MVLINSLIVLGRHINKVGIIIYDNPQAQEIMKLNQKPFNTIFNISKEVRAKGFLYLSNEADNIKKWYLETRDTSEKNIMYYHNLFSTTYYLTEISHYWECPHCLASVPDTWVKCNVCGSKDIK